MPDQLDLFGASPAPPPAAAVAPAPQPWRPNLHLYPPKPVQRLPGVSPASIAALADIALVDELPPIVPGASPRCLHHAWPEWATANLHRLRGKNLACFCPLTQPCHADVLLEAANA